MSVAWVPRKKRRALPCFPAFFRVLGQALGVGAEVEVDESRESWAHVGEGGMDRKILEEGHCFQGSRETRQD